MRRSAANEGGAPRQRSRWRRASTAAIPQAAGTLRNTEVTEQTRVNVEINAPPALAGDVGQDTSWNDPGVVGGLGPCDPHPADTISPNPNSIWTQVGVRERNQRSLFGMFGVDLLNNRAHARVELQPALAGKGFIPVAVPEQDIRQAQIRYYRECGPGATRRCLRDVDRCKQLGARGYQTVRRNDALGPNDRRRGRRDTDGRAAQHARGDGGCAGLVHPRLGARCGSRASKRASSTSTPRRARS